MFRKIHIITTLLLISLVSGIGIIVGTERLSGIDLGYETESASSGYYVSIFPFAMTGDVGDTFTLVAGYG